MLECEIMPEYRSAGGLAGWTAGACPERSRRGPAARFLPRQRGAGGPAGGPPALRMVALLFLAGCATAPMTFPANWETVPQASLVGDYCIRVECAAKPSLASTRVWENRLFNASKPLTPVFAAIDSFDVSLDRKETVFPANRKANFDT